MDAQKTSPNCNKVDNCSLTLVLDKRTNKSTDEYPMAICFTINRKRYYHKLTDTPLQNVLDQIAAKPSKGARVFPDIFKGSNDEKVMRKLCVQENSNIKDRVIRVCKEVLGWEKEPSSTWARHAFASNLKMLKVPEEYVLEGMGLSQGNNITRGYQDMYPLEMRFEFNNKLLNLKENQEPEVDVDSMTPEEMKEFIKKMIGK